MKTIILTGVALLVLMLAGATALAAPLPSCAPAAVTAGSTDGDAGADSLAAMRRIVRVFVYPAEYTPPKGGQQIITIIKKGGEQQVFLPPPAGWDGSRTFKTEKGEKMIIDEPDDE